MDSRLEKDEILAAMADEFTLAFRSGQHPNIKDYQTAHPKWAQEIEDLLTSIALIEQVKADPLSNFPVDLSGDRISQLTHIGDYTILREIGRGGMGVVFAAQHRSLGRKVAIKVLPTASVQRSEYVERFRREAQAAARLHHTNVVSVFGVGEGDGFHYYIMDLVDGLCLSEVISRIRNDLKSLESNPNRLEHSAPSEFSIPPQAINELDETVSQVASDRFRQTASIGIQLADALSYAHSKNILHRDIKPANIMLDRQGMVWITDFGLAKDFEQQEQLTQAGDVVGTPQYLVPESLEGKYDQRSEVYGVGLVLYELVALRPAYGAGSPGEILRAVATQSPAPVRKIDRQVPIDLATIIDKALSREPSLRYSTAEELKHDLMAFAEDRPISARRPTHLESSVRWARQNPATALLAGVSCLLLLLVAVIASVGFVTTANALSKEARIANSLRHQQVQTESARQLAEQNLSLMQVQYERAEANVSLTIEAFDEMFKAIIARGLTSAVELDIDGYREISGIETALTKQDAEFLQRMVSFYEQFVSLNAEKESLREESARAYRRLGNIYQLVGQTRPAIEAYERSLEQLPALNSHSPGGTDLLLTRVRTQNELSSALRRSGAMMASQHWYHRSIQILEQVVSESNSLEISSEELSELRLELARTLGALGFNVMRAMHPGRPELGPLPAAGPGESRERVRRQWVRQNKPYNYRAIEILDELILDDPDNPEIESVRATCYWNLAAASMDDERSAAIEYRKLAVDSLERLVEKYPENSEYRYLLALACSLVAVPMDRDDFRLLERGTEVIQELAERQPSLLDYQHLHANLRIKQASYHLANGQSEKALSDLRSARSSILQLLENATSDRSFVATIGMLVRELQELQRRYRLAGNPRAANEISAMLMQIRSSR